MPDRRHGVTQTAEPYKINPCNDLFYYMFIATDVILRSVGQWKIFRSIIGNFNQNFKKSQTRPRF